MIRRMFMVEHESVWTRDERHLGADVRAALAVLDHLVAASPSNTILEDKVSARIDDHGVVRSDLPLASGDALWIQVGDGWDRMLWIDSSGHNDEWTWDAATSPAFVEAVLHGRAARHIAAVCNRRVTIRWAWQDANGIEHVQAGMSLGPSRTALHWLGRLTGRVEARIVPVHPGG